MDDLTLHLSHRWLPDGRVGPARRNRIVASLSGMALSAEVSRIGAPGNVAVLWHLRYTEQGRSHRVGRLDGTFPTGEVERALGFNGLDPLTASLVAGLVEERVQPLVERTADSLRGVNPADTHLKLDARRLRSALDGMVARLSGPLLPEAE